MFYLASTRFNDITWEENRKYREECINRSAIYGTTIKIHEKYPLRSSIFVVEMNNDRNQIMGIGLIRNSLILDKKYCIYKDQNYNRYIYKGEYWVSREQIERYDTELVEILENMLFKGKSHLKRQSGISIITPKLFTKWNYNESVIREAIKQLFIQKFKENDL